MAGDVTTVVPEGQFNHAVGASKILLLSDGRILASLGNQILVVGLDGSSSVLAGSPQPGYQDGPVETAQFSSISGMALAENGNLFIADSGNNRIRVVRSAVRPQPAPPSQISINVFAGITINGIPGRSYRVEATMDPNLGNWQARASFQLPTSPFTWIDPAPATGGAKSFYRVVTLE
jgi:hypothetical protein